MTRPDVRTADHRAQELLDEIPPEQRITLLHQHVPALAQLGLVPFSTGTEALHGVAWLGPATVFPQPVGLAATWDVELIRQVGTAVAEEVRARHEEDPAVSLNVWAPVVNPLSNPWWGRTEEGWSEDPHLTGELAGAYAAGLRGDHPDVWRTVPTLKHVLGYRAEADRAVSDTVLGARRLHEDELPAFLRPIRAGVVGAVMPSYNLVDGVPAHLRADLLALLREAGDLLVVSDAGAAANLVRAQRVCPDAPHALAAMLRAGVDSFTEDGADPGPTLDALRTALDAGLIDQADVDRAAIRLLALRVRTGELDASDPWRGTGSIGTPAHRALARRAASAGVVLLDGELPIRSGGTVAVVGPLADRVLTDWYSGTAVAPVSIAAALAETHDVSVVDGADRVLLRARSTGHPLRVDPVDHTVLGDGGPASEIAVIDWGDGLLTLADPATGLLWSGEGLEVRADADRVGGWTVQQSFRARRHEDGSWSLRHRASNRWLRTRPDGVLTTDGGELVEDAERFDLRMTHSAQLAAAQQAAAADTAVVVVGNDPHLLGRETEDRPHLRLPAAQAELWRTVRDAHPGAVLVIVSSYPYALPEELTAGSGAVLWSCHAGEELGHGVGDVLTGAVLPSGRLAQSWPRTDRADGPPVHRFAPGAARFPFGHGLTGSTITYQSLDLDDGTARVTVANTGRRPAAELVQLYAVPEQGDELDRLPRLAGHHRVRLAPGESAQIQVALDTERLARWDPAIGATRVHPGRYRLTAGPSAGDQPLAVPLVL